MSFDRLHRLVSSGTAVLGISIVALSGDFQLPLMVAFVLALAIGPQVVIKQYQTILGKALNIFAVVSGLFFGYLAFSTSNFLYYALFYAMLLSSVKGFFLFQRNDFMQFYVLSFLQCIAGAVINPGLSFGVLVIPYVVLLTLCLLMSNVRKWVEETADASVSKVRNERDIVAWLGSKSLLPAQLLWLTAGLSISTFLVSVVFFFLFPRVGMGFFAYQQRPPVSMPGFAETVELGAMTNALEDTQVVMRVKAVGGDLEPPIRMRGQSLDYYDGQKWSKTTSTVWPLRTDQQNRFLVDPRAPLGGMEKTVEVYLEPISGSKHILFAPQTPVAFEPPPNDLRALRPEKWRKLFKSKLRAFADLAHRHGAKLMLHSCGSTRAIWPDLIDIGLDIYDTIQPEAAGMAPEELAAEFGKHICLHGAISTQRLMPFATPAEIERVVRSRIESIGAQGGLILAPSHNFQPDTPVDNILAMYRAAGSLAAEIAPA